MAKKKRTAGDGLLHKRKEFITNNPEYSVPVIEVNAFNQNFKSFIEDKVNKQRLEDIMKIL